MKRILSLLIVLGCISAACAQNISGPPSGDNQKARVSQWIGPVEVAITYSSPDVHAANGTDRKGHIWGELVHAGFIDQGFGSKEAPWRAGANENTIISFSNDVQIDGKTVKAGTYGLFMSYAKEGASTWILSSNSTSWGSFFYDPKEDVIRVAAQGADAPYTEYLTYGFDDRLSSSATAYVQWDNKKFSLKIEVPNVNQLYVSIIEKELRSDKGFDTRNYTAAAQFCADNKINLEEGLKWADAAMSPALGGTADFASLQTKAAVLTAMGKDTEASTIMDEAIKMPSASILAVNQYGRSLIAAGKKEKAMEVFLYNQKKHPEEKFYTYAGLARGYTALGDKKNAIKNWETAIKNIPDNQKNNLPFYQGELAKLKG